MVYIDEKQATLVCCHNKLQMVSLSILSYCVCIAFNNSANAMLDSHYYVKYGGVYPAMGSWAASMACNRHYKSIVFIKVPCIEEDSVILFSTFNSPQEYYTSPFSSAYHSPPPQPHQHSQLYFELSVRNLSYTIFLIGQYALHFLNLYKSLSPLTYLKAASFDARGSETLAIVGPSSTGKSSLLRIISGRVKVKDFDPKSVLINGRCISSPAQLRKICGFVTQEDNLLPLLTVKETLMLSAMFRLNEMSSKEREERVENLMHERGLFHVAYCFVGDEDNRGISVIELLSSMAEEKHRTVVLSIQQPSHRILRYIPNFFILTGKSSLLRIISGRVKVKDFDPKSVLINGRCISSPAQLRKVCGFVAQEDNLLPLLTVKETLMLSAMFKLNEMSSKEREERITFINGRRKAKDSVVHNGSLESLEETITKLGFQILLQLNALEFALEIINTLDDAKSKMYTPALENNEPYSYTISPQEEIVLTQQGIDSNYLGFFSFFNLYEIMFLYSRFRKNKAAILGKNYASHLWPRICGLMASSLVLFRSAVSPDFISEDSLICTVLGPFFLFSGYFIPKENIPKYWLFMY
ncbi:hypothetical protein SADUNF_Sadunf16G0159700 [Salix dunnii]|uniref:ABC transporter domain-containing protein n=1 Tax=Salix dunnii TaxID=1413687 RepID=A0A835JBY5_9ROSI|nr:hypothetical protein SADUNF_Sadunf16G0159700 [Salix dunnii]